MLLFFQNKTNPAAVNTAIRNTQPRPLKVGTMNTLGYVYAYTKAGKFTIKLPPPDGGVYPDFSCNVESYTYNLFTEIETLSSLFTLKPGESRTHTEVWSLE